MNLGLQPLFHNRPGKPQTYRLLAVERNEKSEEQEA